MTKILRSTLAASLVLFSAALAYAEDGEYQVKLHRPETVGDKFAINCKIDKSSSEKVEVNGAEVKNDSHDAVYALDGTLTVTAVDKKGRETGFHLVVKKLEAGEEHAVMTDVVEAGAEIDGVYKDGKAEFSLPLGGLSAVAQRALASMFEAPQSEITDDQMFGTTEKKNPGDTWPVDQKAMAADAAAWHIAPEKIDGKVTLFGKTDIAGIPALEVHMNVDVSEFSPPGLGASKDAKMAIKVESKLPLDEKNDSIDMMMNMTTHGVFEPVGKDGKKALVTLDSAVTRTETRILQK